MSFAFIARFGNCTFSQQTPRSFEFYEEERAGMLQSAAQNAVLWSIVMK